MEGFREAAEAGRCLIHHLSLVFAWPRLRWNARGHAPYLRRALDLHLEGDNLGTRKTQNVFAIRTPVAIAVGLRYGGPKPDTPARVRYAKIEGTREAKLATLDSITGFGDVAWKGCFSGWQNPLPARGRRRLLLLATGNGHLPWQHSDVQLKRKWPIGETRELLEEHWNALLSAPDRRVAFRDTDGKMDKSHLKLDGSGRLDALSMLRLGTPAPERVRYSYRLRPAVAIEGRTTR